MAETVRVVIDKNLHDILNNMLKDMALQIKKMFFLETVTIHNTASSRFLAHQLNGKKSIGFKINKTGLKTGIIEFT